MTLKIHFAPIGAGATCGLAPNPATPYVVLTDRREKVTCAQCLSPANDMPGDPDLQNAVAEFLESKGESFGQREREMEAERRMGA